MASWKILNQEAHSRDNHEDAQDRNYEGSFGLHTIWSAVAEQVIKQIWISPHFGVLSRYPSAADKPFPFIRPVVLPPHSAVKRPVEVFFSLRPPGRSP